MNLNVPLELHNRFKSITASQGQNMTDVLLEFIQNYVDDHADKHPKRASADEARRPLSQGFHP